MLAAEYLPVSQSYPKGAGMNRRRTIMINKSKVVKRIPAGLIMILCAGYVSIYPAIVVP